MKPSTAIERIAFPAGLAFLLFFWFLGARLVGHETLLPGPHAVFTSFLGLLSDNRFWSAVLGSALRAAAAFILSFVAGAVYGIATARLKALNLFLKPFLVLIKTLPVMTIIVLAFLWMDNSAVPIFVCVLINFLIFAEAFFAASQSLDPGLLRMATVYKISRKKFFFDLLWPSMVPTILSATAASASMTWKIIITAEYISLPKNSLGALLYDAKAILDSRQIFALVLAVLLLGGITETVVLVLRKKSEVGT